MLESRAVRVLRALHIEHAVKGKRAWYLCRHHDDHSPSAFVRIAEGDESFHCFVCKAGGTLAELVAHVRGCSLRDAIRFFEKQGKGFEPPRARVRVVERPAKISPIRFRLPPEVYVEPPNNWPSPARAYAQARSITPEQVERFGLGYAVEGRLAGRLILPVRDHAGRCASYSARDFTGQSDHDPEHPRYLTPHESERANLDALFGEHLWPKHPELDGRIGDTIIVAEGALNALAIDRAIELPVAAIGGSDARPGHAAKLARFRRVLLFTDPDPAGDHVASALASMLGRHVHVARVRPPDGKDADTMPPAMLREMLLRHLAP